MIKYPSVAERSLSDNLLNVTVDQTSGIRGKYHGENHPTERDRIRPC